MISDIVVVKILVLTYDQHIRIIEILWSRRKSLRIRGQTLSYYALIICITWILSRQ